MVVIYIKFVPKKQDVDDYIKKKEMRSELKRKIPTNKKNSLRGEEE